LTQTRNSSELSFADYQESPYRPGFDGLRGVGFLMVVTAHIPAVALFSYLQGWTAVWVFFVISGYLVAMLLIREERRRGRIAYGAFLIRRFFRIVPSYTLRSRSTGSRFSPCRRSPTNTKRSWCGCPIIWP
jgi:peptidoglycan/LPS O-acetylase OafA/YrhL